MRPLSFVGGSPTPQVACFAQDAQRRVAIVPILPLARRARLGVPWVVRVELFKLLHHEPELAEVVDVDIVADREGLGAQFTLPPPTDVVVVLKLAYEGVDVFPHLGVQLVQPTTRRRRLGVEAGAHHAGPGDCDFVSVFKDDMETEASARSPFWVGSDVDALHPLTDLVHFVVRGDGLSRDSLIALVVEAVLA